MESDFSYTESGITKNKTCNLSPQTGAQRDKQNQPHSLHEEGNISCSSEISHKIFIGEQQSRHHLMRNQRTSGVKNGRVNLRKVSHKRFRKSESHVCEVCRKVFSSFMVLRLHLACHIHGNLWKSNQEKFGSGQQKNLTVNKMIKFLALGLRKKKDLRVVEKCAGSEPCESCTPDRGNKDKASLGMSDADKDMIELPISDTDATDPDCRENIFELFIPEKYYQTNTCSSKMNASRLDNTGILYEMVCARSEQARQPETDNSSVVADTQSDTLQSQEIKTTLKVKRMKIVHIRKKQIAQRKADQLNISAVDCDAMELEDNTVDAEVSMSTQDTCSSLAVPRPGLDQSQQNCDVNSISRKVQAIPHQESRPITENSEKVTTISDGHAKDQEVIEILSSESNIGSAYRKRPVGGVSLSSANKCTKKSSLKCLFCDVKCESRKILNAHIRSNHSDESKLCPKNSSLKTSVQHHEKYCLSRISGIAKAQGTAAGKIDSVVDDGASAKDCKPMSRKDKIAVIDNALKSLLLPLQSRLKSSGRQDGNSDEADESWVNGENDTQQDKESDNIVGDKNGVTSNVDICEQKRSCIDILGPYMETYTRDELRSIKLNTCTSS